MDVQKATLKSLKEYVGGLSKPSKMPGWSYGLPAKECHIGGELQDVEGSTCFDCYALKGFYAMYKEVYAAQYKRLNSITKEFWVDAMIRLIGHYSSDVFRWHDAGDIQSIEHLKRINDIALALPNTKFWLPTREINKVRQFLEAGNEFAPNLTVRLSAIMNDTKPPKYKLPVVLPTSTVHTKEHLGKPGESIVCGAPNRGGECGPCRACWSPKVQNVSYHAH